MNEAVRNAIVERHQAQASVRAIARELGISRHSVARVLAEVAAQRRGPAPLLQVPPPPQLRASLLDAYEPVLRELLARYPDMTAVRLFEELRARGFTGQYTIVRQRVGLLRPRPTPEPVLRFETPPGAQAQMDYGIYDLDFTQEGRRRVYLFSYVLAYSRRAVFALRRRPGFCDHAPGTRPGVRLFAGRGRHLPVRQSEGRRLEAR